MSDLITGQFITGQRWISNTEAELGLGIVSETDHRFVTLSFPAAGEQRIYAKNNAPLTRVQYRVGEKIKDLDGNTLLIEEIKEDKGYLSYQGLNHAGETITWGEVELDCFVQFNKPQDRLFAGQIDRIRDYKLRHQTLLEQQRLASLNTTGLIGPRVQLLPHQLYIADNVGKRFAPRVLLADEVGLGKTIEAGLIIHQQLIKGLSQRILIAVPESLTHQWLVEMLRRFNLSFTLLDEERCQALELSDDALLSDDEMLEDDPFEMPGLDDTNPFESAQLILCSLPLLTDSPKRLQQALSCDWDLLVVDEAHHLQWQPNHQCPAYDSIEQLARIARGLLLLTATPEQLGIDSHFARLRLLDPDRYYDLETFKQEQRQFQPVNQLVQQLLSSAPAAELLADAELTEQLQQMLGQNGLNLLQEDSEESRNELVNQLLDRHGTGRVLFRNTRAGVKGFSGRQLHAHPLSLSGEPSLGFADAERVQWLSQWLKQHRKEKVLIICSSAETALDLETHLNLRGGVRSAAFYEGLSLLERDRAAAYFADLEDGAQVLVCSEIGSEGRNFQFAHHLVMFDLPLNPDLIEQRIGRLDRIGQSETVQIHIPYLENSHEHTLLRWYHEGLNCFEHVCPIGQTIFEEFEEGLNEALDGNADLELLIEATRQRTELLLEELKNGRDRLLELNSCKTEIADALVKELQALDEDSSLSEYMNRAFDIFGVDHERHSEEAFVAHPSDHMHAHHFPGLPDEGITATYSRQQALSREDMQYLTWEHPMVSGVMDMVLSSDRGNTAICTIKLPPLKPGSLLIEGLFQFNCPGPRALQLPRFMPNSCTRLVADNNLKALEPIITSEHFNKLGQSIQKPVAKQLVQHARADIERIVGHLESKAESLQHSMIEESCTCIDAYYDRELSRLTALAEVNPNIREEEIQYLQILKETSVQYMQSAQLRLDAIRVAVVTD
ncbi:RNA polymerase-associated protein RapA [Aestuariicella hydrocarbonica]|uniref:RNA polymerase-associated protein RapA n=1 Tax=Pseudomaricurvus hydrocarbonicus TaxID=1470433 RepID=A0A9E5JVY3_9GAMM|nr:RNA polymerase-associated protein RapA [Aestuariicella hydrocarbonica]NHO65561.1 RNA polymerase-associated protein RapA [Aestuariicella hydrocarbonica]